MSDADTNFVSDKFQQFCKTINVEQAVSSVYHHQSNGQVEVCIKFVKCTFKKCANSGGDINMALLQICTTPLGQGLPSLATQMFNRQVCGIMPVLDCKSICIWKDSDDKHHSKLVDRQHRNNNDASPVFASFPTGSAGVVQWEDGTLWTHGTVGGTGDHNHHDRAYTVQLTMNGRWIRHNRQHIKPTSVSADTYLHYHATKQSHTRTDSLQDILKHINNNPMVYSSVYTNNINNQQTQCNKQTESSL